MGQRGAIRRWLIRHGGERMDFHSGYWRWLEYDILALVVVVLAITLLELTVLGFLGLIYPQ
jgi:hypothetical protein